MSSEPLNLDDPASFLGVVKACNRFDGNPNDLWAFYVLDESTPTGYMPAEVVQEMDWNSEGFEVLECSKRVHLNPKFDQVDDPRKFCEHLLDKLCVLNKDKFNGFLARWTFNFFHCVYLIVDRSLPQMLFIAAPLQSILGALSEAVLLNVYTTTADGEPYMWVAKRSQEHEYPGMMEQIVSRYVDYEVKRDPIDDTKHEYPGMTEQVVSSYVDYEDGGDPIDNTLKAWCWRKVGLIIDQVTKKVSYKGKEIGTVKGPYQISFYDRLDSSSGLICGGLEPGVRFVYDLKVPFNESFGTKSSVISEMRCMPVDQVKRDLIAKRWKPDSGLVMLAFLSRMGYLKDSDSCSLAKFQELLVRKLPLSNKK